MAAKTYEVLVPRRYGTRMLQAGDTIDLTQPRGRIYSALGYVKPHKPKKAEAETAAPTPSPAPAPSPKATPNKAAPRKKAAPKK